MSTPQGLACPGCGEHATYLIGDHQALCGNESCCILMWDPAKTLEELAADIHLIDPPWR